MFLMLNKKHASILFIAVIYPQDSFAIYIGIGKKTRFSSGLIDEQEVGESRMLV